LLGVGKILTHESSSILCFYFILKPFATRFDILRFNVVFFEDPVNRAWVRAASIAEFRPGESAPGFPARTTVKAADRLAASVKLAETASALDMGERRKRFSFSSRYKGNWSKANNNNTPDDRFLISLYLKATFFKLN
jgi:hypothetical protein